MPRFFYQDLTDNTRRLYRTVAGNQIKEVGWIRPEYADLVVNALNGAYGPVADNPEPVENTKGESVEQGSEFSSLSCEVSREIAEQTETRSNSDKEQPGVGDRMESGQESSNDFPSGFSEEEYRRN